MTMDALVVEFIDALKEGQLDSNELVAAFAKYEPRKIVNEFDREVWSIALNYDTLDVRYVEVDGALGTVQEVRARTAIEVRTEYVQV